ncbi:MAG TPA: PQQ-binding-like beta-propeller repeat protein [Halalkalibaculum sp.]|nr:PQQ-binding-like beta-propeller repeat protein [Halalkalibaculum sp.]
MAKLKSILALSLTALLFSSCELLGIGGKDKDDPSSGEVAWRIENNQENIVRTQPAVDKNRTYFLQDGHIKSATLNEGRIIWSNKLVNQGGGAFSRKIIQTSDRIFVDIGFEIHAYDKGDGNLIWNTEVSETSSEISGLGGPIMSQDEDFIYAGRRGYVLKVRKEDGQIIRRYPLDRQVPEGVTQGSTDPIISPFGDNVLYVPTSYFDHSQPTPEEASGNNIFAFNSNSGELIWHSKITVKVPNPYTDIPGDSLEGAPFVYDIEVTEDKVVALAGFYIVALDRMSGETIWKTYFPEGGFDVGLTVDLEGVYAASIGTFATKVDLETGEKEWMTDIRNSNTSILTVQNGRLYFTNSGGGDIWVLDTKDGSVIYNEKSPGHSNDSFDVYISSLGIGEGYMVNVGSKAVYCLKVPE